MTMPLSRRRFVAGMAAALIVHPAVAVGAPAEPVELYDRVRSTRFEDFLKSHGIRPGHLARESGYSRRLLLALRLGRIVPIRRCIVHLTAAAGRILGERVSPADLFELPPADERALVRWIDALANASA
jgi:hypothetical protein